MNRKSRLTGALLATACALWGCATATPRAAEPKAPKEAQSAGGSPRTPLPSVKPEGDVVPVEPGRPETESRTEVGKPYVDFTAKRTDGEELRLSDHVGRKVVLLQFWGVRCAPCLAEMGFLSELQRQHEGQLQVIGVNTDRAGAAELRQAMAARRIAPGYPSVADPEFAISQHYTQWLVPVTVLIDRKGTVRAVHTGFSDALKVALQSEVGQMLGEGR